MNPTTDYAALLDRREDELRAALGSHAAPADDSGDTLDFKDLAARENLAAIEDVQAQHLADELEQVLAARQRLREGRYGECVRCGEPIAPERLAALPATPCCTACQADAEARRHTAPPAVASAAGS